MIFKRVGESVIAEEEFLGETKAVSFQFIMQMLEMASQYFKNCKNSDSIIVHIEDEWGANNGIQAYKG